MSISSATSLTAGTKTSSIVDWRARAAQVILWVCAAGALLAAASMAATLSDSNGSLRVAETWQVAGLPVFAGLFAILAFGPRRTAGLWELVIANKVALVVAGATFLAGNDGANEMVLVDGVLVVLLVVAYVLTRGWTAWTTR